VNTSFQLFSAIDKPKKDRKVSIYSLVTVSAMMSPFECFQEYPVLFRFGIMIIYINNILQKHMYLAYHS
jgi:hypothetical protein